MSSGTQSETVIATFSALRIGFVLLVYFAMAGILIFAWLGPSEGTIDRVFHHGMYRAYATVVGTAAYLYFVPKLLSLLKLILFEKSKALWLEGCQLVYLSKRFFCVAHADVECVRIKEFGPGSRKMVGISILLKNGTERVLPTATLSEAAEIIFKRVEDWSLGIQ